MSRWLVLEKWPLAEATVDVIGVTENPRQVGGSFHLRSVSLEAKAA
jgi:hypothetical protein